MAGASPTNRREADTGAPDAAGGDAESSAARYDRLALPFVRAYTGLLLAGVVPPAHGRVLDHGAGTGEVSLEVHRRHPTVSVIALEPEAGLLARLRHKAGPDADWLTVLPGTLDSARITTPVDLALSQLVLPFVTNPQHELQALHRRTTPGGMLRAAVLGGPDRMRAFAAYWHAAAGVVAGAAPPADYPHLRFADPGDLGRLAQTPAGARCASSPRTRCAPRPATRCGSGCRRRCRSTPPTAS